MRNLNELNHIRRTDKYVIQHWGWAGDETCGVFMVNDQMMAVVSTGEGWDHVSISRRDRCPTWEEMEHCKRMFFLPTETAMQLHVPPADHINIHKNVLHLWRPQNAEIPMPPKDFV